MMISNQLKISIRIFPIPFSVTFYIYFTQLIISTSYFWEEKNCKKFRTKKCDCQIRRILQVTKYETFLL
jgi:hypothetical protein